MGRVYAENRSKMQKLVGVKGLNSWLSDFSIHTGGSCSTPGLFIRNWVNCGIYGLSQMFSTVKTV